MSEGSLPSTTIWGTWLENIEVWDIDTDSLADLSGLIEITLKLRDPRSKFDEMTLTLSNGDIVVPSTGIIQWTVDVNHMGTLAAKLYEVIILLDDGTTVVPLFLGPLSIVE